MWLKVNEFCEFFSPTNPTLTEKLHLLIFHYFLVFQLPRHIQFLGQPVIVFL